jgi:hypothetical protein
MPSLAMARFLIPQAMVRRHFLRSGTDRLTEPYLTRRTPLPRRSLVRSRERPALPSPLLRSAIASTPRARVRVCSFLPNLFEGVIGAGRFFVAQFMDQRTRNVG